MLKIKSVWFWFCSFLGLTSICLMVAFFALSHQINLYDEYLDTTTFTQHSVSFDFKDKKFIFNLGVENFKSSVKEDVNLLNELNKDVDDISIEISELTFINTTILFGFSDSSEFEKLKQ